MASSNQNTVASKHLKVLRRRGEYLQKLKDEGEANSYDLAELAAVNTSVTYIEQIKELENRLEVRVLPLLMSIEDTDTLDEIEAILQER